MKSLEFRSYKSTPNDQYMLGVAEIRVGLADGGKVVLRYKHVKTKDGTGSFFTPATYSSEENGVKKYIPSIMFDSRSDDEEILEFLRVNVNQSKQNYSAFVRQTTTNTMQYPHGLVQNQQASSMKEVAEEQPLPF